MVVFFHCCREAQSGPQNGRAGDSVANRRTLTEEHAPNSGTSFNGSKRSPVHQGNGTSQSSELPRSALSHTLLAVLLFHHFASLCPSRERTLEFDPTEAFLSTMKWSSSVVSLRPQCRLPGSAPVVRLTPQAGYPLL